MARRQKISQMNPKGANLQATDLLEVSVLTGTGYDTYSITGQEIINAGGGGGSQDLQQVTDIGSTTTNSITITSGVNEATTVSGIDIKTENTLADTHVTLSDTGTLALKTGAEESSLQNTAVTNPGVILEFPDKATGSYTIATTDDYVPYTGATTDVDLGEFELKAGQLELDQTPTGTAGVAVMRWNDTDGTIDLGLKGGNVTLQVGQEQVLRVVNKAATNINLLEANYQAVRVTGAQGQRLKVDLAQATTDALSAETIGLVTETINNNQEGFITTSGIVRNINTTGSLQSETWADGDIVYLSPTTAGRITNIKPSAPNHLIIIGYVISAHATQGSIFVKVDNGYELDELHNVAISTPLNNQSLVYETSTTLWKNKALTTAEVADSTDKRYQTDAQKTNFTNPKITVECIDALTVDFYAMYSFQIDSVTAITNSPTTTILVNNSAYTFGVSIATGAKITVTLNTAGVVNLNTTRL